jgi:hypothetical protein
MRANCKQSKGENFIFIDVSEEVQLVYYFKFIDANLGKIASLSVTNQRVFH